MDFSSDCLNNYKIYIGKNTRLLIKILTINFSFQFFFFFGGDIKKLPTHLEEFLPTIRLFNIAIWRIVPSVNKLSLIDAVDKKVYTYLLCLPNNEIL